MYKSLDLLAAPAPYQPGHVYVGQDATHYYYQRQDMAGLWGAIKKVAKGAVSVVKKVGGVAVSLVPGGGLLKTGLSAALEVIRSGTQEQVAQVMAENLSPEQRAELERAYMERRAAELAQTAKANALPIALGVGAVALVLMSRRRR